MRATALPQKTVQKILRGQPVRWQTLGAFAQVVGKITVRVLEQACPVKA